MHDLYSKLYLEKHEHHQIKRSVEIKFDPDDVERRMQEYLKDNYGSMDFDDVEIGDEAAAFDAMF